MKTEPIVPARLRWTPERVPFSAEFGDVYHPAAGALLQAEHVFLAGNGLPARWQGHERFVILETGFGLGNNFLATWDAWRRDDHACERLHFISIEKHPLSRDDLRTMHAGSPLAGLVGQLIDAWPLLTPNLHRLSFEGGRIELLLALGDVTAWLPELVAQVDAFYLDGFAPAKNPQMWQPRVFKALARIAAPEATAATWTAARDVRKGLTAAGFEVHLAPGRGGKRDITLASYAPAFTPRRTPQHVSVPKHDTRHAVIVGAGLAGCATALALAEQGWTSTLIDRRDAPAQETSGNPGGLFHGIVNPQDGAHARFNRAAALEAQRIISQAVRRRPSIGSVQGLLRLENSGAAVDTMAATLLRLGLPGDYVQAVDAEQASRLAGLPLAHPAWFYPGGGWVRPVELADEFLRRSAGMAQWRGLSTVQSLHREGSRWYALDATGAAIAEADTVVLANAGDALRLLGHPAWPIEAVRGQISMIGADRVAALPRIPIAGAGYLLPEVDGRAVFGATSQSNDSESGLRDSDHAFNLAQLGRLAGASFAAMPPPLHGRTGWRWVSDDRLPLIGAVPDVKAADAAARLDQPRLVPRLPGLFVFTALGSRGITWSALGAQVLASAVTGAPSPLEASLLDSVDPARFITRTANRESAHRHADGSARPCG